MKLRDEETKQERIDRMTLVDKNRTEFLYKFIPVLGIILVFMIASLIVLNKKEADKNIGNPYECSDCKEIGRACRKHKDFDHDAELLNTIKIHLYQYKHYFETGVEENYTFYVYGESYSNLDCDFCKSEHVECEGCRYTRQAILNYTEQVLASEDKDRLCEECKNKGYPYCSSDVTFVAEKIFDLIKNK